MKKQAKKPDLEQCKRQLSRLTQNLCVIDSVTQEFLDLSEISPSRRTSLNDAGRRFKQETILAQTDLWGHLVEGDYLKAIEEGLGDPANNQQYRVEWVLAKPKKKKRKQRK